MERDTAINDRIWAADASAGMIGTAEPEITTGRAIAIATGAAALAGGISALFSRRPAEPAQGRAGHIADDVAERVTNAAGTARDAAAGGAGAGRDLGMAVASGAGSLGARAKDGTQRGGQRITEEIENLTHRLHDLDPARFGSLLQGTREKTGELVSSTTSSVAASVAAASERARHAVPEATGTAARAVETKARGIGHGIAAGGQASRERITSIPDAPFDSVGSAVRDGLVRFRDDVTPVVRDVAVQAAAKAIEVWDASREEAQAALTGDGMSDAVGRATELTSRAKDSTAQVAARAGDVAHETATELAARGAELAARTADGRERIGVATRQAATATGETSREVGSAAVWAAIAGGVVYYALLDERRREQVNQFAQTVFGGARELLRDIQGYDADF
ncbi:MAG: hypothetical protein WKF80_00905 [Thermomicrobiales bacterium]